MVGPTTAAKKKPDPHRTMRFAIAATAVVLFGGLALVAVNVDDDAKTIDWHGYQIAIEFDDPTDTWRWVVSRDDAPLLRTDRADSRELALSQAKDAIEAHVEGERRHG